MLDTVPSHSLLVGTSARQQPVMLASLLLSIHVFSLELVREKLLTFKIAASIWHLGGRIPDFNCQDDGSNINCDSKPCNTVSLNRDSDVANVYYKMDSLNRFHTYSVGLNEAFVVSAIATALNKDDWAETFYVGKDAKSITALRLAFAPLQINVGIQACLAGC